MAATLKQTLFAAALTVVYVRLATTDLVPLTGHHVCVSKTCVAVEKNESYVGCDGCPRDQEPPIDDSPRDCREFPPDTPSPVSMPRPLPSTAPYKCSTSRRQTCHRTVIRYEERSTNVKHCCRGYVEKEEGKCVWHHPLHHLACQMLGARLRHFRPTLRCGANARCVENHCVCARGYTADSAGYHCVDIDECTMLHLCEHYCNNTDGGYTCECKRSHDLHSNGHNCTAKTVPLINPASVNTQKSTTTASTATSTTASTTKSTESTTTPRKSYEDSQRAVRRDNASTSTPLVAGLLAGAALIVAVAAGGLFYLRRRALKRRPVGGDTEHSAYLPPGGTIAIIVPPHDGHLAFENHLYQDLPPHDSTAN